MIQQRVDALRAQVGVEPTRAQVGQDFVINDTIEVDDLIRVAQRCAIEPGVEGADTNPGWLRLPHGRRCTQIRRRHVLARMRRSRLPPHDQQRHSNDAKRWTSLP